MRLSAEAFILYDFPRPPGGSPERVSAPKAAGDLGPEARPRGHPAFGARPPSAPRLPAQQAHCGERRRRRGKQVPGCQSRTRAEQERTGLNRREQIPAGAAPPPPARPAIHTAYVAGSRARPRSLACWAGGGAARRGAGRAAAALPLYTPQPVTGSSWLGPP